MARQPITLILLFTLPVLLVLAAFAYWMIKRKQVEVVNQRKMTLTIFLWILLQPKWMIYQMHSVQSCREMMSDELDDDNLFGDDDLLDDVLAEELEESLDDALEDSIEEPLVDDAEIFDELGDEICT